MTTQADTSAPDRFLKLLRKALAGSGLSLNEAARQSDISPAYFSRLINGIRGVPGDETISKLEEVLDIQPRGLLFDAAGRQDVILAKVVKKDSERILMRALAPLTNEDFAKVVKVAEQLAEKYNAS